MSTRSWPQWRARTLSALILGGLSVLGSLTGPLIAESQAATTSSAQPDTSAPVSAPRSSTVVSLTFDDGYSSQWAARDILRAHQAHATFYIPSGFIGLDGRLTTQQLRLLQADGNEIGGHTVNHTNLATADDAEQRRQICDDRIALTQYGFRVTSFAYPFGSLNTRAEAAARSCGYNSARADGGLQDAQSCLTCPVTEKIPPVDPFSVETASPVVTTTTLQLAEDHVAQAEAAGGGWVPLVFHDVCEHCSDQDISPDTLSALLAWLQTRVTRGTVIKTVDQVVGGSSKAAVKGPQDQRAPAELVNASLETPGLGPAATTSSYCWTPSGYGVNTASWTRVPVAHSGSWAEQVTVHDYRSGDQKLIIQPDAGSCSPAVTPGKAYNLSAWYSSTAPTRFVVYYRTIRGNWLFLSSSPEQAASATWRNASWTTSALPPDATRISYGLQIATNGTLTIDDYTLSELEPPPPVLTILLIGVGFVALVPTFGYLAWTRRQKRVLQRQRARIEPREKIDA